MSRSGDFRGDNGRTDGQTDSWTDGPITLPLRMRAGYNNIIGVVRGEMEVHTSYPISLHITAQSADLITQSN